MYGHIGIHKNFLKSVLSLQLHLNPFAFLILFSRDNIPKKKFKDVKKSIYFSYHY